MSIHDKAYENHDIELFNHLPTRRLRTACGNILACLGVNIAGDGSIGRSSFNPRSRVHHIGPHDKRWVAGIIEELGSADLRDDIDTAQFDIDSVYNSLAQLGWHPFRRTHFRQTLAQYCGLLAFQHFDPYSGLCKRGDQRP